MRPAITTASAALLVCLGSLAGPRPAPAQPAEPGETELWTSTLEWRCIGPDRGGRVSSVAGVVGDPMTAYMGATGGGVWKTTNGGSSWSNITDGFVGTGSVGAVAVAPSDPNVVWIGMGEPDPRGNFSHGDGVYRSTDAGKTWTHLGLDDSRQIGRIAVHPDDEDTALVAALGHVFGPNAERGVFKTTDGGETWRRVLYVNDRTGAIDVCYDPLNPRVLYAGLWQMHRRPWELSSGGEHSGLYRSTDGGETWEELTDGLPEGIKGKVGVSASRARAGLVFAIIEAEDGGVFRSTDGGDSWTRVNDDRSLRQRAWYYTRIEADPADEHVVWVCNVQLWKSEDGGREFSRVGVPHVDNHAIWIDPLDNRRLVNGNDGGANVSFDGGRTWSRQDNQPTAQFYHVTTDNRFPYRVYGAQQDNSTASISSRARAGRPNRMYPVGGGESGQIAVHPDNPDIVYAGSYMGYLTRYDHAARKTRNIMVWPDNPMGAGAEDLKYRFQWTFPIVISPHDPGVLYVAGNVLFRSTDEGHSWQAISPDLTTNDKTKQKPSGGPITKDNTSVEYYCTIFSVAESPVERGLIWAGTDDGLVHLTPDGGETWERVTPPGMGDWPKISMVEASPHDADTAFLAVNRYKMDDFTPYVYRTTDRGETWELVADGIEPTAFVRSVREDPVRPGLLYAATELGVYYSLDMGDRWRPLQKNLPVVPVTDLVVKDDDLVISTQGRSFWILDDVTPLRHADDELLEAEVALLPPAGAHRQSWDRVRVHYLVNEEPDDPIRLEFLDAAHEVIRSFGSAGEDDDAAEEDGWWSRGSGQDTVIPSEPGLHVFEWNMRHDGPTRAPGLVGWPPTPRSGPLVAPGEVVVRLTAGDTVLERTVVVERDPRVDTSVEDLEHQEAFLLEVRDLLSDTHEAISTIRTIRGDVRATLARATKAGLRPSRGDDAAGDSASPEVGRSAVDRMHDAGGEIVEALTEVEEALVQTRSKSAQDPLNYPVKLNDKLAALLYGSESDYPVTAQSRAFFAELGGTVRGRLEAYERILGDDLPEFNRLVAEARVPAVVLPKADGEPGEPGEGDVATRRDR
jgi:photosystem II stability/assembly factor-like uncharacterized protein